MIQQLLTTEYLFWLVAVFFFVIDNIKLVSKAELLLTETVSGEFKPFFVFNSFEINGKGIQLLNLFLPFTGFIKLNISPKKNISNDYIETIDVLKKFKSNVFFFKIISIYSFFYLLSGLVLTYYYGLGNVLMFLLPLHLANLFFVLFLLLIRKNKLGISNMAVLSIFFDCLTVPFCLPNIVRKIYSKKTFNCDGFYYFMQNSNESEKESLSYSVNRKFRLISLEMSEQEVLLHKSYFQLLCIKISG